ncbi:DUF309 domain-containing protein [Paenibacillus sepulcri]|uniref:DUF309 domain-containing protein n=2 Tax=Paenibacillus sepulcri TaxID=359917 RepID=A0ABS7C9G7_9BACL|nr:DUF309 domain-containing protein [Paenibacillus sepulcri]
MDEDYFECHEVMEEMWLEEGRNTLYQGLLQAAVGLHHWRNDNYSGAVKLFTQAENKLASYPDVLMGLDLGMLRQDMARVLAPLHSWVNRMVDEGNRASEAAGETVLTKPGPELAGPPPFAAFRLLVQDDELRRLVGAMSQIPLEQRLHAEDEL